MTLDRTRWCELLVGLQRVEVLDVVRLLERLVVTVESTDRLMGCGACGTRTSIKDRDRVELADLPAFGSPVNPGVARAPMALCRSRLQRRDLDRGPPPTSPLPARR